MSDRLPAPGPSYIREREIHLGDRRAHVGMSRPTTLDDGWWLAILWAADHEGLLTFRDVAPAAGPPPDPPLLRLGPILAGNLSGLILEEDNRLSVRLGALAPPADPTKPWRTPLAVRAAFKWEPMRAATMRPNELAATVVDAFARGLESLGRR
ncbi:MAG: hypothetical protein FJ038_04485 [Chloroflexi bacterium]|nr:hypothetical protein [Chloroflexota bacterium]